MSIVVNVLKFLQYIYEEMIYLPVVYTSSKKVEHRVVVPQNENNNDASSHTAISYIDLYQF